MSENKRYFVIGYIGSKRMEKGEELAGELGCPLLVLDDEIVRLDGRSINKLCMINGEHAYRNKEFEILSKLCDPAYELGVARNEEYPETLVIVCGDGTILDDMSFELLEKGNTVFVDEPVDVLWERVKNIDPYKEALPYAFLYESDSEKKERVFREMYELRLPLYKKAAGISE